MLTTAATGALTLDKAAFKALYRDHAMRECVGAGKAEAADTLQNASQECRAERADDPDAFAETYGTNENTRNAFGKCVSTKVQEADDYEEAST